MTAWRSGKMPTTSVRLRASLFSRSFIGPHGSGKRVGGLGGWSTFEPGAVVAERVGDVGVAGGFAVPAAGAGVRLRVCQQGGNARGLWRTPDRQLDSPLPGVLLPPPVPVTGVHPVQAHLPIAARPACGGPAGPGDPSLIRCRAWPSS